MNDSMRAQARYSAGATCNCWFLHEVFPDRSHDMSIQAAVDRFHTIFSHRICLQQGLRAGFLSSTQITFTHLGHNHLEPITTDWSRE